jgi:hypothetical protein
MATARNVLGKLKSSDGRIRVKTLSGLSAVIAAIALLVGVLPVMATHQGQDTESANGIHPELVRYGGGSGACAFVESAAEFEAHDNNPATKTLTGPDETKIKITVSGQTFGFEVLTAGMAVYDVVVNGGPQNLHYDYDGSAIGPQRSDSNLHAPAKNNGTLNNLSHINICYDIASTLFVCGEEESAIRFGEQGELTGATATIFSVENAEICEKLGFFFSVGGETTLDFGTGTGVVTGRADFFKQFDGGAAITALEYDGGPAAEFEEVPWCTIGEADAEEFGDFVSGYPELPTDPSGHTACKVYEEENADGFQHTVVYFEFEDPQFR